MRWLTSARGRSETIVVRAQALALVFATACWAGCIDEYRGSNVQIDFAPATPVQASAYAAQRAGELPTNIHFTLYAFDEEAQDDGTIIGRLFALETFEIHRIVDLASPCFIDVGEHVPIPGLHVSHYAEQVGVLKGITDIANPPPTASEADQIDVATAIQRQRNVTAMASDMGPKAVTSASSWSYPVIAASCEDVDGIPPPDCVDAESNRRRLDACQREWQHDRSLFEGTDRVLTLPLNGVVNGFVVGLNPVNLAPIGGAGFFVDESLEDFEGFAIYWQYDGVDDDPGTLFLYGRPEQPTRGVIHVSMTSLVSPAYTAELAIFANINEDDVHF
jgi:hypothetical protein